MCVPLPLPPSPSRLNQPETENLPVLASDDAGFPMATLTPLALAAVLVTPPPTRPAVGDAATDVEPALTATPPATAFASASPPWMTTA